MGARALAALPLLVLLAVPSFAQRLPTTVRPDHYDLTFAVDLARARFEGTETIHVQVDEPTTRVVLHAVEIEFHEATIGTGAARQKARVSLDQADQTATLTVPRTLARGPTEIRITYTGILNDALRGFYLSRAGGRRYAVTQLESTDARRAFPCFDEPAFKATFAVTLVVDRGDTAISNGTLLSDTPGPGAARHTLKFATSPKMSSYLVAMAVGDFQCVEGAADAVPIRVCATPDKKDLGYIALEAAQQILKFYNGYYAVKYPFGKLDVVAVPDFAAGAMENTAAIFFRETDLLADSKTASLSTRKNIASILAHEIAHQWFGDLVTMKWWDDLWLNEGFATWMANRPLAAWKPEWNVAVDEGLENQTALNLDSMKSTRPIRSIVKTPAQIEETFDAIAYEKGAAVLRMIESYVGAETFRKGVNVYLQKHAYGNATSEDFWTAIAATSGKPVDRIMPTFLNQPGFPLVEVSLACTGGRTRISLTQKRFFLDPALMKGAGSGGRWQVPLCVKTPNQAMATCHAMTDATDTLWIDGAPLLGSGQAGCAPWAFINAGAQGYFRTSYQPELIRALAPNVASALTAPERLSLAGDAWALVLAGRHTVADYMILASGFGKEPTSGVLSQITKRLGFIRDYLTTSATRPRYEAFTRTLLGPLFDDLGLAASIGDTDERRALRASLIGALGTTGNDPDVIASARATLDRALGGGEPLDPTAARAIVRVAAEHGDTALYEALSAAAERATSPEERYRYLYALADFKDPALVQRGLEYSLSADLRSQDAPKYLAGFLANPAGTRRAWTFVKQHWTELQPKIAISFGGVRIVEALGSFCDARSRDDVKTFFAANKLGSASQKVDQTIERINNCIDLREKQTPILARWLAGR